MNWDYRTIFTGWLPGQDLVVNATLHVSPKPPFTIPIRIPSLPSWILSGVFFYLGAASFLTVLIAGREERHRYKGPIIIETEIAQNKPGITGSKRQRQTNA